MNLMSTYNLKCYNKDKSGKDKYEILDKIGKNDLFRILKDFITNNSKKYKIEKQSKLVYRFDDIIFDDKNRVIHGWFQVGHFGSKHNIIDIETGDTEFIKEIKNAEIVNHHVFFFLPKGFNIGISLLHCIRGKGIKTLFHESFKEYFKSITKLNLQMNSITYTEALDNWKSAVTKEIRLIKYVSNNDIVDNVLGNKEKDVILKQSVESKFGVFGDFFNPKSEQKRAVEILSPLCEEIKTVVEINGRKKVFKIGSSSKDKVIGIDFPDDLVDEGNPPKDGILDFCIEITNDFSKKFYQGLSVSCDYEQ